MSGNDQSGYRDLRPEQQSGVHDAERVRQAQQAERGAPQAEHGDSLEPRDSRNVTGAAGGGTGAPGGAFQQEGMDRWSGDSQQDASVAARQPDATTAAGQQPGIDRRELQAEQQARQPQQAGTSPEAQHMAAAHVPGQQQAQQSMGRQGMQQSLGGMSQGFTAEDAARAPEAQGFVDQQSASMGGLDQPQQGEAGSDDQVESTLGVGEQNLASNQQSQFDSTGGGQTGNSGYGGGTAVGQIREHMEVVGADGVHLGTVDAVDGDRIKLTKADSDAGYEGGAHHGHHHYISCGLVAAVEGNRVRLSATAANAYAMEEEK